MIVVEIPQNEWTLICSGVTAGTVDILLPGYNYYQTYRRSGQAPPSNPLGFELPKEAVPMFPQAPQDEIASSVPIDVYVLCRARDQKIRDPGRVRVNI